jgi:predicted translin family RNA/ssDNA-binding protein
LDGISEILKTLDDLRDDVGIIAREIGRQSKQKKDS